MVATGQVRSCNRTGYHCQSICMCPGTQLKFNTAEKRKQRQLERKWQASRLLADREQYVHQCSTVINLIRSCKSEYYLSIIKVKSGNQKALSKIVQKLHQKPTPNYYPPSENNHMLPDGFVTFFYYYCTA